MEAFVRLPGEKHACPCILTEVSRSVFGALFPASQILEEFHQEVESMKNVKKYIYCLKIDLVDYCRKKKFNKRPASNKRIP